MKPDAGKQVDLFIAALQG